MTSNYNILISKLDEFIRKYYKNMVLRGLLYSTGMVLLFYLSVTVLEYFAHFNTGVRTFLFYSFLGVNAFIVGRLIVIPLLKLYRLGSVISYEQAADIIGQHFNNVQDKLLNVLQLHHTSSNLEPRTSNLLVEAAIDQKTKELKPIPFSSAIDLTENRKYLKYTLAPVAVLFIILFAAPSMITDSTKRLVKHSTYYEKEAPFHFNIENKDLKAIQQEDFELQVKLTGNEVPDNIYVSIDGNEYKLNKENTVEFSYLFKNLQKTLHFKLAADGYQSKEYELSVLPNPILLNFNIALDYPKYLHKNNEVVRNTGDLLIPVGTKVTWNFNTQNTNLLRLSFSDTTLALHESAKDAYSFSSRIMSDKHYAITTANEFIRSKDSVLYSINVIPDQYPVIDVEDKKDSVSQKLHYFKGQVKDDYGFSELTFNYRFINKTDSSQNPKSEILNLPAGQAGPKSVSIPVNKALTQDQFFYAWDLNTLNIASGDAIEYYFEIWDNDGVHGAKSTRTQKMIFKAPTLQEITENTDKNNSQIKEDLKETIKDAKDLQKQLNDLNKKVLEKKELTWEEKKKMEELLQKQTDLQHKVESIKNENQKNNTQQSEFKQVDQQIAEKQKELEELLKQVLTPEMKQKMEELQKLMSELDKNKVQDQLEKMKMNAKDVEKELDRALESFKRLEVEQKLQENIEKLNELKKDQDELAKKAEDKKEDKNSKAENKKDDKNAKAEDKKDDKTAKAEDKKDDKNAKAEDKKDDKKADAKDLEQKQAELNKKFEDFQKDMKDMEKKNKELEQPNQMENTDKKQEGIKQEMSKSDEQLQQNQKKKASESQKKAGQEMQELSEQMQSMQQKMQQEQQSEDAKALRQILDNLLELSFDQEALMNTAKQTATSNPQYTQIAQNQKKLQDDAKMIEDSLLALSKRQTKIQNTVNREINAINMNMGKAIAALAERQTSEAASRQQFSMTSINNLALILNESLQNMQQQSQQSKPGKGSCNKPGGMGKKPSASNLRKMQQDLNEQIQKMKEAMEKGKKEGAKGKDGKGSNGSQGMSEQLAKMAAQQEYIRQQMQKTGDGKEGGSKAGGDAAKKMEETETDLVNKLISQETINRQQEILNRLLDYEKAEKEKEQEEKRESNEAKKDYLRNPNAFLEYNRLKEREIELLKTVPPTLNPFYKSKVNDYFNNFDN